MGQSPGMGQSSGSADVGNGTTGVSDGADGDVIVGAPDDSTGPAATLPDRRTPLILPQWSAMPTYVAAMSILCPGASTAAEGALRNGSM